MTTNLDGEKEPKCDKQKENVDKYRMVDAEMETELEELQAGEERRGSNASQAVDCCMETMVEQFFAVGADQARSKFSSMCQVSASGGCNEGTPASSLELDLPRVRCEHGECAGAEKLGADDGRKRPLSNSPSRLPMEEDASLAEKEKRDEGPLMKTAK